MADEDKIRKNLDEIESILTGLDAPEGGKSRLAVRICRIRHELSSLAPPVCPRTANTGIGVRSLERKFREEVIRG